ncbi:MAG TPA: hypothetical protein VLW08_00825 [Casimicrobiaceae bacterium]|nr:hypothetical protein [Casimicrobiaceae bacterium]
MQPGQRRQQRAHRVVGQRQQLFEVVEDQQRASTGQRACQLLDDPDRTRGQRERSAQRVVHGGQVGAGGERHEGDDVERRRRAVVACCRGIADRPCQLDGEPGLAAAAGTEQRDEAVRRQPLAYPRDLPLDAEAARQVRRKRRRRLQAR